MVAVRQASDLILCFGHHVQERDRTTIATGLKRKYGDNIGAIMLYNNAGDLKTVFEAKGNSRRNVRVTRNSRQTRFDFGDNIMVVVDNNSLDPRFSPVPMKALPKILN